MNQLNKRAMSYQQFEEYLENGGSAVICIVNATDGPLYQLKEHVEQVLKIETSMNVYHSGKRRVALNRHYDTYDVIVLQLEGEKEWEVQTDFDSEVWQNITLRPGDVLYMPKGIMHAATTAEGFNTTSHVTIGLDNS